MNREYLINNLKQHKPDNMNRESYCVIIRSKLNDKLKIGGNINTETMNKKNVIGITKRVWKKNATLNAEAVKSAARRRVGNIVNNKLADVILKNIDMPKWLVLVGGYVLL